MKLSADRQNHLAVCKKSDQVLRITEKSEVASHFQTLKLTVNRSGKAYLRAHQIESRPKCKDNQKVESNQRTSSPFMLNGSPPFMVGKKSGITKFLKIDAALKCEDAHKIGSRAKWYKDNQKVESNQRTSRQIHD